MPFGQGLNILLKYEPLYTVNNVFRIDGGSNQKKVQVS